MTRPNATIAGTHFMQTNSLVKIGTATVIVVLSGIAVLKLIPRVPATADHAHNADAATTPEMMIVGAPASAPEPVVRKTLTTTEWIARFRSLHGLGKAELLQRLAEMGFPLRDRTLDLLLKSAGTPDEFAAAVTQHLMLFHPNRLIADAIKNGVKPKAVAGLFENVSAAWRQKKLENWMPTLSLVDADPRIAA